MGTDHAATLRQWRERGADRVDPVRFGFIDGLVRRAAAQSGAARALLDEKITGLMAGYAEVVARVPAPAHPPTPASTPARVSAPTPARAAARVSTPAAAQATAPRGPLGTLADLINHRGPAPAPTTSTPTAAVPGAAFPNELKALGEVRDTWARLDAEQRVERALAEVPANAGPLNSYQLILRTLTLMRDVSPDCLQRFMTHVDALIWLERTAP